jgi:hypothetical protein
MTVCHITSWWLNHYEVTGGGAPRGGARGARREMIGAARHKDTKDRVVCCFPRACPVVGVMISVGSWHKNV